MTHKASGTLWATLFPDVPFDRRIIYLDTFKGNPDYYGPIYSTKTGIYTKDIGMGSVGVTTSTSMMWSKIRAPCPMKRLP